MPVARFAITADRLDPVPLTAAVARRARGRGAAGPATAGAGAVATLRRPGPRPATSAGASTRLDYEAYEPLALRAFERIDDGGGGAVAGGGPRRCTTAPARSAIGEASVVIVAGVAASRRRLRGVPLRHRARQADRADLEARVLRGRRRLDRRRDRRSGRRGGAGAGASDWRARDRPAVRAAARPRRRRRAARATSRRAPPIADVWAGARRASIRRWRRTQRSMSCAVNARLRAADDGGARRRRSRVPAAGLGRLSRRRMVRARPTIQRSCSTNCSAVEARYEKLMSLDQRSGGAGRPGRLPQAHQGARRDPGDGRDLPRLQRRRRRDSGRPRSWPQRSRHARARPGGADAARRAASTSSRPQLRVLLMPKDPERREERHPRDPRRHRRRRSGAVRRRPVPHVLALRRAPGLAARGACRAATPAPAASRKSIALDRRQAASTAG